MTDIELSKVEQVILFQLLNSPVTQAAKGNIKYRLEQLGLEGIDQKVVESMITKLWAKTASAGWGNTLGITLPLKATKLKTSSKETVIIIDGEAQ